MEQELHAGLVEQVERHQLEPLRIERHHVAGGERRRDRAADVHQALEQLGERAADHRLARAVVGGQQRGRAAPLLLRDLGVERHERHHQRRGGVAAEEAVALGEDHARAGLHRAERGADAGGSAADHQHVGVAREQRLARRQLDGGRAVRPL